MKVNLKLSGKKNLATVYVAIDGWMIGFHQDSAVVNLAPGDHTISFEIAGEPGGSIKIELSSGDQSVLRVAPKIPAGEYRFADFADFLLEAGQ